MHTLRLVLVLAGLALFVVGDAFWLARQTRHHSMNMRVTGGLVGAGVALVAIAVLLFALDA